MSRISLVVVCLVWFSPAAVFFLFLSAAVGLHSTVLSSWIVGLVYSCWWEPISIDSVCCIKRSALCSEYFATLSNLLFIGK